MIIQNRLPKNFLNNLCQYVASRDFGKAENLLLHFMEKTLSKVGKKQVLNGERKILNCVYYTFNRYYYFWSKKHHLNIENERKALNGLEHTNYLISHSSNYAEMDDLLYGMLNIGNNNVNEKNDLEFGLRCYKKYALMIFLFVFFY